MPTGNPLPPEGVNAPKGTGLGEFTRLLVGIVIFVVAVTAALALMAQWLAPLIPFEWERSFIASVEPDKSVNDAEAQKALEALGTELASNANLPAGMTVDFHLVPEDRPNAFATLGGQIMITRGLLDHVETENGLAMVVAHEIAHIRERHPVQAMSRGAVIQFALLAVSGATGEGAVDNVLGSAGLMTMLTFNRSMEREADSIALEILRRHYGHTLGSGEFFRSVKPESSAPAWTDLMRTHPRSDERLATLADEREVEDAERQPLPEALSDL